MEESVGSLHNANSKSALRNPHKRGSLHVLQSWHPHDESFFLCLLLLTRSSGQIQATAASAGFPFLLLLLPRTSALFVGGGRMEKVHAGRIFPFIGPLCGRSPPRPIVFVRRSNNGDVRSALSFSLRLFFRTTRRTDGETDSRDRRVWTLQTYKIGDVNIRIG